MKIGEILLRMGVSPDQLQQGLTRAETTGQRLCSALVYLKAIDNDVAATALAHQTGAVAALERHFAAITPRIAALVNERDAKKYMVVPMAIIPTKELVVAMRDPLDAAVLDVLTRSTGHRIRAAVACEGRLKTAISTLYGHSYGLEANDLPIENKILEKGEGELDIVKVEPRKSTYIGAVIPSKKKEEGPSATQTLLKWAAFLVILGGGGMLVHRTLSADVDSKPQELQKIKSLGINLEFSTGGWRYSKKHDKRKEDGPIVARSALFYQGAKFEQSDLTMVLVRQDDASESAASVGSVSELLAIAPELILTMSDSIEYFSSDRPRCKPTSRRSEPTVDCVGKATYRDQEVELSVVVWKPSKEVALGAFFLKTGAVESMEGEISSIVPTVDLR